MNIYHLIKKDHDEAKDLMARIMRASAPEKRQALLDELKQLVLVHAKTEEATWYAALSEFPEFAEKINHTKEEHDTIEDLFSEVAGLSADQDRFLVLFGEIKMGLEHHFHEEEDEMFPKSQELISDDRADELGREMKELKDDYIDMSLGAQKTLNVPSQLQP